MVQVKKVSGKKDKEAEGIRPSDEEPIDLGSSSEENDGSRVQGDDPKTKRIEEGRKAKSEVEEDLLLLSEKAPIGIVPWAMEIRVWMFYATNIVARFVFDNGHRDTYVVIYNHQFRMYINDLGNDRLKEFVNDNVS